MIATKHYNAVGVDHEFQRDLTNFMHRLVADVGEFTLAEIGYLHMSTLNYNLTTQSIELNIYFDVRLAGRRNRDVVVAGQNIAPVKALNIFQGAFFVGNLEDTVSYDRITVPKVEIVDDDFGRKAVHFKDSHKMQELDVLVLHCSYPLTVAVLNDIDLKDPNYKPIAHIIAKAADDAMKSVVSNVSQTTVPLSLDVEYTEGRSGYDFHDAVPYLQNLAGISNRAEQNHAKIIEAVADRTKKAKKKANKNSDKWFNKYA